MNIKIDGFVLSIIGVVCIAWLFPGWGGSQSGLPLDLISSIGISLIFFFYGLKLSPAKMKTGLQNWKLHVLVQLSTFIIFPAVVIAFYPFVYTEYGKTIWLAFLFMAALPSTVSSSVVMVSMARGNIPAAIFNASISGLIGIIITPLWVGLFLQETGTGADLGGIYLKLLTEILAPVVIGLLLQRRFGFYALKYNRYLTLFDKAVILLIIYKSFAQSFEENIFSSVSLADLALIIFFALLLFCFMYFITGYMAKKLKFSREDQITAQFCGTKKSLVHGTVFSKILFPNTASIGIILLPLMLFHAIQIFMISIIAARLSGRNM